MHQGPKEAGWVGTRFGLWRIISSWQLDCRPELCQYVTQRSTNLQTLKLHSIHSQPELYGYHGTIEILHITIWSSRARVSLPLLSDVFSFEWLHICDVWCSLISCFIILCAWSRFADNWITITGIQDLQWKHCGSPPLHMWAKVDNHQSELFGN